MTGPLRILQVEDSENDASLIARSLEKAGYEVNWERVETAAEMRAALAGQSWDAIISDYRLPQFDAPSALAILREAGLDIPFLVVSGTIGEKLAVRMMKTGAHDYLMKNDLARLAPAVVREIKEAQGRRDRTLIERQLRESEDRFRRVVEGAPYAIFVQVANRFRYLNSAALAAFGAENTAQLLGQPCIDRVHPDYHAIVAERARRLQEGQQVAPLFEEQFLRMDGTAFDVEVTAVRFPFEGNEGAVGFFRDITERKKAEREHAALEAQFRQAQKLESVGRLAGGIAHDFNNLLTVINGYSALLLRRLRQGDPLRDSVAEIHAAGERAADLTRQLLAFSREEVIDSRPIDLNDLIAETRPMFQRLLGDDVELVMTLPPGLGKAMADPGQLHQVLMNLAVNARDAMPGGGTLTFETANVELDGAHAARLAGIAPGPFVRLAVSDTGTGIGEEIRQRIFDPFFTTKCEGEGTGLGLSTVYGIVRQSGGAIEVDSEPGRGARFTIYLPRVEVCVRAGTEPVIPAEIRRGSETILVVEDQEEVRRLTVAVLEAGGYRVLTAANGVEALLVAERHPGPVHLLLTDVVMPRMSGKELAGRVKSLRPEMRVLYMSGHVADRAGHQRLLDPGDRYIPKPFAPEFLTAKVQEALDLPQTGKRQATVLVVEDNALVRNLHRKVLESGGYAVRLAADAAEALAQTDAADLDVLLTDLRLPDRSGAELVTILKQRRPGLKVVMMSASFDETAPPNLSSLPGVQATLAKPASEDKLLDTVKQVLSS